MHCFSWKSTLNSSKKCSLDSFECKATRSENSSLSSLSSHQALDKVGNQKWVASSPQPLFYGTCEEANAPAAILGQRERLLLQPSTEQPCLLERDKTPTALLLCSRGLPKHRQPLLSRRLPLGATRLSVLKGTVKYRKKERSDL